MKTRTNQSVGTLVLVAGIVMLTVVTWWTFGRRVGDGGFLDGVDVAAGRDGPERNRDVVRRHHSVEPNRSESDAVATAADSRPSAATIEAPSMDLPVSCLVEIIAIGNGVRLNDAAWRILDDDGETAGRRDKMRPVYEVIRSPARLPCYVRSGRRYRAEVCAEGYHPLELAFALEQGQREATIEAVLRGVDSTGLLRVRFEGPSEARPSQVQFRIGSTESSESGADGPHWIDEVVDGASGTLALEEDGTAVISGLALRTKRHRLAIKIPDFPLTDFLPPEAVFFDFVEGGSREVSVRLERGGHLKAIVRFPIEPADAARIGLESTDGSVVAEHVEVLWSFDHFGGVRLRDLALRQPTGHIDAPVDRPLRTLRPLRPGRYVLTLSAPGLAEERVAFEIKAGATTEIDITMRRE